MFIGHVSCLPQIFFVIVILSFTVINLTKESIQPDFDAKHCFYIC